MLETAGTLRIGNITVADAGLRRLGGGALPAGRGRTAGFRASALPAGWGSADAAEAISPAKTGAHLRAGAQQDGLLCVLLWENGRRKLLLRAQITDQNLIGRRFEFTVSTGTEPRSVVIGTVSHAFTEVSVTWEGTLDLLEEQSRGGTDVNLRVEVLEEVVEEAPAGAE